MKLSYEDAVAVAKSVTEHAIQCELITGTSGDAELTAKEVAKFYCTFLDEVVINYES